MPESPLTLRYTQHLQRLTGDAFERAVCTRLGQAILGFQPVPRKPQGDGGLDGFSHSGERAYCCYGPEACKNRGQYESKIVAKFAGDLRRLFELDTQGKRKLVTRPNSVLPKVLPKGQRLTSITLLTNWLESNQILGPLHTKVREYSEASLCAFVIPTPALRIIGPAEIAHEYPVDESAFASITMWTFMERVQERAEEVTEELPSEFEDKMARLEAIRPDQESGIKAIAANLRQSWRMALAFDHQLLDTLPRAHHELERARRHLQSRIAQELLSSATDPWRRLGKFSAIARSVLRECVGETYGEGLLINDVAEGEIARLIGECTINWRLPRTKERL